MSTFPAEMVRLGSICVLGFAFDLRNDGTEFAQNKTYDDCDEWILVFLVRDLRVHVDSG